MITVLCGGVGAARFLAGLLSVVDSSEVTAIVNVGDDSVMHGLHISPDLDTITYTLAGAMNTETGWGLRDETWRAMEMLRRYGSSNGIDPSEPLSGHAAGWFSLGDQDLGTHLYRTSRMAAGLPLSAVTAEIAATWGLGLRLLPVTDGRLRTVLQRPSGERLAFQEYFVREHHEVTVSAIDFEGAELCEPAPGVLDAIGSSDAVIIAPSNPLISIDPVLAVPGVVAAMRAVRQRCVAISPIVGGKALKGPAASLMEQLGVEPSVVSIADRYSELCSSLVVDEVDAPMRETVERQGVRCVVTDTVMRDQRIAAGLAETCLEAVGYRSRDSS